MKLVFVHGAGESSLSYYYQLQRFRTATGIDLPGHPLGEPCQTINGYVEWVRGYVAARRYKDIVLCGHSMGGAIAQTYALRYPQELKGLILLGTGARLRVHPDYLKECEEGVANPNPWLENRKSEYAAVEPELRQALIRRAAEVGPAVKLNDLLCCDAFDIMDQVQEIRLPTLVVCGSRDVMTPVKYTDYLADMIPGSKKVIVEGAGHFALLERHPEVNRAIEEFVSELASG